MRSPSLSSASLTVHVLKAGALSLVSTGWPHLLAEEGASTTPARLLKLHSTAAATLAAQLCSWRTPRAPALATEGFQNPTNPSHPMSFVASRPLTTRLLKLPPEAPAAALGAAAASAQPPEAQPRSAAAAASQAHAGLARGPGLSPGAPAAGGRAAAGAAWGGSARADLLRGSGAGSSSPVLQGAAAPGGAAGAAASQLLPVSAVAVGAAPDRASGAAAAPSGADIAEDALAEERTARRAARFMASGDAGSLQH